MKTAFECAAAYLDKLPPAVSGAGGHAATFTAACWCVRFGLGDGEAMALLRDYSRQCSPPWTEKDLRHKLADARRVATGPARYLAPAKAVRVIWRRTAPRTFAVQTKTETPAAPVKIETPPPAAPPIAPVVAACPHYTPSGDLVVPFASPARFHYWQKRDASDGILTLAEIRQSLKP